jgi:hypothetical protein
MSRISLQNGWMLYVSTAPDGRYLSVCGDVMDYEISVDRDMMAVHSLSSPHTVHVPGPAITRVSAVLTEAKMAFGLKSQGDALWEAIQGWPDPRAGRQWPPEMQAMTALARKYPGEYRDLLQQARRDQNVSRLAIVADPWLSGLPGLEVPCNTSISSWRPWPSTRTSSGW